MITIQDIGSYTFPALLKNSASLFGECNALSMVNGTPITYNDLTVLSGTAARLLYRLGIRKGSKIAILSTSMPQWGAVYFSIVNQGAIALPLLPDFNSQEIEAILTHAQAEGIFVSKNLYDKLKPLPDHLLQFIIRIEDFTVLRIPQTLSSTDTYGEKTEAQGGTGIPADILLKNAPSLPEISVSEDDTASIIYTSGTTGRSKGVELSHKNLVWTAIQCQTVHRVNKLDKCLSFLPLSHVYEFTIGFVMQMLNGSCVYYLGKPPTVTTLLPAMAKIHPTIILSVPLVVEKIYKNKILPLFSRKPFIAAVYRAPIGRRLLHRMAGKSLRQTFGGRIKFFGIGGAKTDPDAERFMKEAHFPYAIGYGLTETSPLLAGCGPENSKPGTIGPVLEGVALKIINADSKTGVGEIVAKGPNVMKGYYKDPKLTQESFTTEQDECGAGWFKTGDLGIITQRHGRPWLTLKGRSKNMILDASGENIYPEDIEYLLNQHPLVLESLVVEDDDGLVALVQLDEEKLKEQTQRKQTGNSMQQVADAVGGAVHGITEELLYKREEILSEIQFFINNKVNRISKIGKVKDVETFEKTASQKIKRYLYNLKTKKKE